ncbi:MAG: Na+/H+ antiporter subunit E [Sulfurovum sp.]|nr:Na+/H+ antiporter subunit E [Sulfurovum sp.]
MTNRVFPHPILSLFLWILWLMLNNSTAAGDIIFSLILAIVIPIFTSPYWEEKIVLHKPLLFAKFFCIVMWDILVSNIVVAKLILDKNDKLHPGFVAIDLDIKHPFGISILANTISLTPGTVSCDLTVDRKQLIVHFLDLKDPESAAQEIKNRYEKPLMEVYESC